MKKNLNDTSTSIYFCVIDPKKENLLKNQDFFFQHLNF